MKSLTIEQAFCIMEEAVKNKRNADDRDKLNALIAILRGEYDRSENGIKEVYEDLDFLKKERDQFVIDKTKQ